MNAISPRGTRSSSFFDDPLAATPQEREFVLLIRDLPKDAARAFLDAMQAWVAGDDFRLHLHRYAQLLGHNEAEIDAILAEHLPRLMALQPAGRRAAA